jgi:hypothetical protein
MIDAVIYGSAFLIATSLLLLGRIWLRGYYFALLEIKEKIDNGHDDLEELLLNKEKLFNFLYGSYLCSSVAYVLCIAGAIYKMVAPNL